MNVEKKFAPIIIPTLNRCDHLMRCVNSLSQNDLAKETDLFISVDYPPSEKYIEGYKRVVEYLNSGLSGFRNVQVYYQDQNLGAHDNFLFLLHKISKEYRNFIFSEDDNVFSADFLDYMNYCLSKYEDDEDVQVVDGYMWPIKERDSTGIVRIDSLFNAWGYGGWIDKEYRILKLIEDGRLSDLWNDVSSMNKLRKNNPFIYTEFVKNYSCYSGCMVKADGSISANDLAYSLIDFFEKKYTLFPICSKVRNYGNDGSGLNCEEILFNDDDEISNRNYDYSSQEVVNDNVERQYKEIGSEEIKSGIYRDIMIFLKVPRNEVLKAITLYMLSRVFGIQRIRSIIKIIKSRQGN